MPISISPSPVIDGDAAVGTREREAQADHGGAAHGRPEIEVSRAVAGGADVVARRAKPRDDQMVAAIRQDPLDELPPVQHQRVHVLRPISRWLKRIATGRLLSKAMSPGRSDNVVNIVRSLDAIGQEAAEPEHRLGDRAHRNLPAD